MTTIPANPPSVAHARLQEGIDDAELLLLHAARTGKKLSVDLVTAVLSAKQALQTGAIDPAIEKAFWTQFGELSLAMQPATIEGIRETRPYNVAWTEAVWHFFQKLRGAPVGQQRPAAYRSVAVYRSIAIILLFVVLLLQIVTTYGSLMLSAVEMLEDKKGKLVGESAATLVARADIEKRIDEDIKLLTTFNTWTNFWFDKPDGEDAIRTMERARLALVWLNGYVLPVLVGGLGAAAQILRSLAQRIREDSYSSEEGIQIRVRFSLGLLAGAAVGLIFVGNPLEPDAANAADFAAKIGPFALPFLAGYSIEFFFSTLDRIINAFKL